jgi:hypothetical protein
MQQLPQSKKQTTKNSLVKTFILIFFPVSLIDMCALKRILFLIFVQWQGTN